jgi:hypothetical protein
LFDAGRGNWNDCFPQTKEVALRGEVREFKNGAMGTRREIGGSS